MTAPGMSSTPSISSISRWRIFRVCTEQRADAAIAHDDGRYAMPRAWRQMGSSPHRLSVVMRVDVDEAWCHELALRGNHFLAPEPETVPIWDILPSLMATSALEWRAAGAVNDSAAANNQIML